MSCTGVQINLLFIKECIYWTDPKLKLSYHHNNRICLCKNRPCELHSLHETCQTKCEQ